MHTLLVLQFSKLSKNIAEMCALLFLLMTYPTCDLFILNTVCA